MGQYCDSASRVEVSGITAQGLWLFVNGKEYFLPYGEYPWFREARIGQVLDVELHHENHLYWPCLDVDLELDCLEHPEKYPLISKQGVPPE